MTIQNLPAFYDFKYTEEDGKQTRDAYLYNDQTFQTLNNIVLSFNKFVSTLVNKDNSLGLTPPAVIGINPPSFTTDQINAIIALQIPPVPPETTPTYAVPVGTMWYDTTVNALRYIDNTRTLKTIQAI